MTKRLLCILALSLVGIFASMWLGQLWTSSILSNFTFQEFYGINTLFIADWFPTIVTFLVIGSVLRVMLKGVGSYVWPFSVGVLSASIKISSTKLFFTDEPSIVDSLWAYSEFFMPVVGCMLGWFMFKTTSKPISADTKTHVS